MRLKKGYTNHISEACARRPAAPKVDELYWELLGCLEPAEHDFVKNFKGDYDEWMPPVGASLHEDGDINFYTFFVEKGSLAGSSPNKV